MWKYRDLGARGESKSGQMDSDGAIKPEPLLTERGQGGQGSWLKGVPGQRADQSPGASPSGQLYKRGHASEALRTSASLLIKGVSTVPAWQCCWDQVWVSGGAGGRVHTTRWVNRDSRPSSGWNRRARSACPSAALFTAHCGTFGILTNPPSIDT